MTEVRTWAAPARVNLIGEHLDYNGGPVLPMAIDKYVTVRARGRNDGVVNVWSQLGARATFEVDIQPGQITGWHDVVAGAVWSMRDKDFAVSGADVVIESDVPTGAGLSSSAATAVATVRAMADVANVAVTDEEVARLARRAETDFMAVPVGVMDQLSVTFGGVQAIETQTGVRTSITPRWDGLSLVVINTGVTHRIADGQYAERHRECAEAAHRIGVETLADAGVDAVLKFEDSDPLKRRVRHVVTETTRVRGAIRALRAGENAQLGMIMTSSHESLRDDFEVSCSELDAAAEAALDGGALGARMTGGGFGGCAIALTPTDQLLGLREKVLTRFESHGWKPPTLFTVRPAPGVHKS